MKEKRSEWKKHKYVAKVPIDSKTNRYFYSLYEYRKYLESKKKAEEDAKNKASKNVSSKELGEFEKEYDERLRKDAGPWRTYNPELRYVKPYTYDPKKMVNPVAAEFIKKYEEEQKRKAEEADKKYQDSITINKLSDMPLKTKRFSKEEDQAAVNPNYESDTFFGPYTLNCSKCSAVYELRRRGYDVTAPGYTDGEDQSLWGVLSWYENPEVISSLPKEMEITNPKDYGEYLESFKDGTRIGTPAPMDVENYTHLSQLELGTDEATKEPLLSKNVSTIEETLKKYGDGARGQFVVWWRGTGGGHSMVWEVEKGKVVIRDCQSNETITMRDIVPDIDALYVWRTDNLKLNEKILKHVKKRV